MLAHAALALALAAGPLTSEELATMGRKVAEEISAGQDGFTPRFDMDGLIDLALADLPISQALSNGFRVGAKKVPLPLGARLVKAVAEGGTLTYRGLVRRGAGEVIQLRLVNADGAFNFFELHVARRRGGKPKVVDVDDLVEGGTLSANLRRLAVIGFAEVNQGLLDRLAGKEQVFLRNAPSLRKLGAAMTQGRGAEALEIYDALPPELQENPIFMRQAVYAARQVDEARYHRALRRYIEARPDDPAAAVMALDACALDKDWAGARRAVDAVERRVGRGDGWMEVLRGSLELSAGDRAAGRRHFEQAVEREPGLLRAYPMLVTLALQDQDWPGVARWLGAWEAAGQPLADVSTAEGFEAFAASKEGKAFMRRKPARR